jgi:Spc19
MFGETSEERGFARPEGGSASRPSRVVNKTPPHFHHTVYTIRQNQTLFTSGAVSAQRKSAWHCNISASLYSTNLSHSLNMAHALEGCVSSLRESLALLDSSIKTLDTGVNDLPRLSKVLQTTRVK